MNLSINYSAMTPWAKIMLVVSLGKVFVAGAGLGLATLGVVDLAGSLGITPLANFIAREDIINTFAIGGGVISVFGQIGSMIWKIIAR